MERADHALRVSGSEVTSKQGALEKVNAARIGCLMTALEQVRFMIECVNKLDDVSGDVSNVGSQAASISTNVAIEAALSGQYEGEFRQVSKAMQEYVEQLRTMSDTAARAIQDAVSIGHDLHVRARESLSSS